MRGYYKWKFYQVSLAAHPDMVILTGKIKRNAFKFGKTE